MEKKRITWRENSRASISSHRSSVCSANEYLEKFNMHTRKFRLKSLVGDALKLKQQNAIADLDHSLQVQEIRRKRKSLMRQAFKKQPRLCNFITIPVKPYVRFRRAARAILKLIQVCTVCKEILARKVRSEAWFSLIDNMVAATNIQQKRKGPRPFVTFVPNENRELEQLTFDLGEFKRDHKSECFLTDSVKTILRQVPGTRTQEQIVSVIRCMKGLSRDFNNYPLSIQKQICQVASYEIFDYNRVIIKKGLPADGYYFVLSGVLVEKVDSKRQPLEISTGDPFGEEDLVNCCRRRHTVITRTTTELFYIHRLDYRDIFDMSEDANNPKHLNICKQNIVFQHFPMQRLLENPGVWNVHKYKYGRLIVKHSNEVDWIYVIKSGEGRVLKYLEPSNIDVKARRKKMLAAMESQSPFYKKNQIFNFIEDREYIRSSYKPSTYHPGRRLCPKSAPPTNSNRSREYISSSFFSLPATPDSRVIACKEQNTSVTKSITNDHSLDSDREEKLPEIKVNNDEVDESQNEKTETASGNEVTILDLKKTNERPITSRSVICTSRQRGSKGPQSDSGRPYSGSFLKTPSSGRGSREPPQVMIGQTALPAFVQIETLHPGQVFGLRACLDPEERGPSVSLVSGECEVLQINKKFFMKHCDDALYSLIRLKAKPFPSQEDLIDRLDVNMQWEEFKHKTLQTFLRQCRRFER